jgi:plastocyanin
MTFANRTWRLALVFGVMVAAAAVAAPTFGKAMGVSIVDKSFEPQTIQIHVGDSVTWTVTKAIGEPHSVTEGKPGGGAAPGGSGSPAGSGAPSGSGAPGGGAPLFDSGTNVLKDNGSTFEHTFTTAGTFDYYCIVHPTVMTGQVVVTAGEATGGEEGIAPERRLIAAGILVVTLVLLFGATWVWRRMNPA